jgi:hypothetical protein
MVNSHPIAEDKIVLLFVVTLDSQASGHTHSYLDFITMLYTSLNSLQFFLFCLQRAICIYIYELMGLTETIEQSNDQQLCIHMCPMEQRKERTYINVLSVSFFLSFSVHVVT